MEERKTSRSKQTIKQIYMQHFTCRLLYCMFVTSNYYYSPTSGVGVAHKNSRQIQLQGTNVLKSFGNHMFFFFPYCFVIKMARGIMLLKCMAFIS